MAGRASSRRRRQLSRALARRGPGSWHGESWRPHARELPREQIDQGGKLPLRRLSLLGGDQGGKRIDEEKMVRLIPRFQRVPLQSSLLKN